MSDEDKKYIFDQLNANFEGECSEVGMYLCMASVAHREGYPEIGLYWEKASYEEAEHAAKFAEILGSNLENNMTDSTE
ncbi:ferritin family protein, partial [Coprococcus eutactus]|uniref:ferritin family protein n=1 Tax=Coprococcus eutactus TaxID=33043 RepID=UPI002FE6E582|nr:NADH peroxidase [Coprococcus eutactus]